MKFIDDASVEDRMEEQIIEAVAESMLVEAAVELQEEAAGETLAFLKTKVEALEDSLFSMQIATAMAASAQGTEEKTAVQKDGKDEEKNDVILGNEKKQATSKEAVYGGSAPIPTGYICLFVALGAAVVVGCLVREGLKQRANDQKRIAAMEREQNEMRQELREYASDQVRISGIEEVQKEIVKEIRQRVNDQARIVAVEKVQTEITRKQRAIEQEQRVMEQAQRAMAQEQNKMTRKQTVLAQELSEISEEQIFMAWEIEQEQTAMESKSAREKAMLKDEVATVKDEAHKAQTKSKWATYASVPGLLSTAVQVAFWFW
ncbi:unknown protein [Seminavis robusta]|uniref:Uncharacterized protein n=1 Tax=Seminavis robusta TaxID=568900 RepID=A0A9N8EJ76_9STRA|nr:unknown protein [Seminavis robusta]|eukprot:Sro1020_g232180.1 n/a (318) ;mRNA; r:36972-38001